MAKAIFITATGTDIGKTYVSALIVKKLKDNNIDAGYYKVALSGSRNITDSDAWVLKEKAGLSDSYNEMVSYTYKHSYSPHLAAQIEGNPPDMKVIKSDYENISKKHDYIVVEGSGGIICPIRYDEDNKIFLEDIIKELNIPSIIIADSGLGTINSTVLTIEYMRSRNLKINGIILNRFKTSDTMHKDNKKMIENITGIKIIGMVINGILKLDSSIKSLESIFE